MVLPKKYLVVASDTGVCVNTIVWDGESQYSPGEGLSLEICPAGSFASTGWIKNADGEWTPPPSIEVVE